MLIPYQEIEIKVHNEFLSILDPLVSCFLNEFSDMIHITTLTKIQRAFLNKDTLTN